MTKASRIVFRAWTIGLVLCLSGCAWLDLEARKLVYRPTPGHLAQWHEVSDADEPLWLGPPGDGAHQVRALWLPQPDTRAPTVLYLHGTFRNVFQNRPKIEPIWLAGFAVLAPDYRGWGESAHLVPSERTIMEDAELAWAELVRREPVPARRVLYGHSMGSGVAVELAVRHRLPAGADLQQPGPEGYGALVLESAFTSLPDVAHDYNTVAGWLAELGSEDFDSIARIGQVDAPKWFLTGTADRTVPSAQSQRLYAAARAPRTLVRFPGGGHSHLQDEFPQEYRDTWQAVLAAVRARP